MTQEIPIARLVSNTGQIDGLPENPRLTSELLTYLYQEQHWTGERRITVNLDFKAYTKTELLRRYVDEGGDIGEAYRSSFSCYNPEDGAECWECKPCFRKFIAFVLNGYRFPDAVVDRNLAYINREILPLINAGTYGRADEEKEILQALKLLSQCTE